MRVAAPEGFPTFEEFIWQTLKSVEELGGSATRSEIEQHIVRGLKLSDEMLEFKGSGKTPKFKRRFSWALTYLKYVNALQNSDRGVWSLTSAGKQLEKTEVPEIIKRVKERWKPPEVDESEEVETKSSLSGDDQGWRDVLIQRIRALKPTTFERLCQHILRESGFDQVEVTGRTGDSGIDGRGVLRMGLISFHLIFQCKRYADSVGPKELRDFRGAMSGRTDKGLFITTGRFTASARVEANREGVPPIELIDAETIADLLRDLKLGVRVVQQIQVDEDYFANLEA